MSHQSIYPATDNSGPAYSQTNKGPSKYGGVGRISFYLLTIGIYAAFFFVVVRVMGATELAELGGLAMIGAAILCWIATMIVGAMRLMNQGCESPVLMMIAGSVLPIVNIYVAWRLVACQEGYSDSGELDGPGKLITYSTIAAAAFGTYVFLTT